ncbi:macrophage migration inhibitory factor [Plakobranchus ocellatus]|uniref:L-dopachrome isomerase n=1 Tax=Plakobranchus ocellatus TaxID=259542 RepID=A0AAV3ZTG5_9GAST|nr:macrophage migration inhibitory factor [Plakobranchus ocellatus]
MPMFIVHTNVKKGDIPEKFFTEATSLLATELGKPSSFIHVQVCPDQLMTFGGTDEPCANITLHCIGVVCPEKNREMAPKLSEFIESQLGIKKNRFYININDLARPYCIWDGKTFG